MSSTYINKWIKENTRPIRLNLNNKTDNDIIEKLDSVPNKTDYIRMLVRNDIKKQSR